MCLHSRPSRGLALAAALAPPPVLPLDLLEPKIIWIFESDATVGDVTAEPMKPEGTKALTPIRADRDSVAAKVLILSLHPPVTPAS
jgi:hypothetical protein